MTVMTWKYFETRQALWKFFMYSLKLSRNDKPRFVHSFFLGSVVLLLNAHDAGDTHAAHKIFPLSAVHHGQLNSGRDQHQ